MRILFASIVIGPLMLFGALPAAAGQSISSDTPIQLVAAGEFDSRQRHVHSEGAGRHARMAAEAARLQ